MHPDNPNRPAQPRPVPLRAPGRPRLLLMLMRSTGLLMYGESGLTPAAFKNIATASMLLVILWIVDFLAWSGLWNMLLTGGVLRSGGMTWLAVFLGFLFATMILLYESSFLSADFRHRGKTPWFSIGIRVTFVLLIAFTTSLPIDLYLLSEQIDQRVHQEQVLRQIPALVRNWQDAELRRTTVTTASQAELDARTLPAAEANRKAAEDRDNRRAQLTALRAERAREEAHVRSLERERAGLMRSRTGNSTRAEELTGVISAGRQRAAALRKQEAAETEALRTATNRADAADLALKQGVANARVEQIQTAGADAKRYETWIHDLWQAKPMARVTERARPQGGEAMTYEGEQIEGSIGIGERLIVLRDVLAGRAPRRPRMTEEDRKALEVMRIAAFITSPDPEAVARQQTDAASLRELAVANLIIFTFLPALVLALKGLFDEDTELYFNREYQRELGFPGLGPTPAERARAATGTEDY